MEAQMQPLYDATLKALTPVQDARLLDAGCGAGLALARAAALGATVTGVDASAPLLDVARARTPEADLGVADIEEIPFPDANFDMVMAFNSIQYAADREAAVAELARVCRPGGTVAIGAWGDPTRCETEALFARLRSLAPASATVPAPLAVSEPGVIEELLATAGLSGTHTEEVPVSFTFTDHAQAWTGHSSSGALQKVIDAVGVDAVRTVIHDVLEADRKPDGSLRQDNIFRYVIATKP
jgi:SAM-dependent methyltransferase